MKNSGLKWLWLSLIAIIADLASKYFVVQRFELYESVNVLPFFSWTYARNYGAAFSFLADHSGWQKFLFLGLALAISGYLVAQLAKAQAGKKLQNFAYAFIIGGAIGNAIDRAYNGFVVDFFHVFWKEWHYPVFNLADIFITCGVGVLILEMILDGRKKKSD